MFDCVSDDFRGLGYFEVFVFFYVLGSFSFFGAVFGLWTLGTGGILEFEGFWGFWRFGL